MVRRAVPYALLAFLTSGVVAAFLAVQPGDGFVREARAQWQYAAEVRIAAQRLESGATEFALQQRQRDGWGELRLPSPRFLPPDSPIDVWRHSGTLQLGNEVEVRIAARRITSDQIEFSLQVLDVGEWSERLLPVARLFPALPTPETWLYSSSLRAPPPTHVPLAYVNSCHIGQAIDCRTWTDSQGRVTTSLHATSSQSSEPGVRLEITCHQGDLLRIELRRLPITELGNTTSVHMRLETGAVDIADWSVWQSQDGLFSVVKSQRLYGHMEFLHSGQVVEIELPGTGLPRYTFNIMGLFSTPIQDNIEHCGNYRDEAPRPLPPPHSASGLSVATIVDDRLFGNSWWREAGPRALNAIGIRQQAPLRLNVQSDDSENQLIWFDVQCGPDGLSGGVGTDSALESQLSPERLSTGAQLRVLWSVDGEEVHDEVWVKSWDGYRPIDLRTFLDAAMTGRVLRLTIGNDLQLSAVVMLDVLFSTPVQGLLEHCLSFPASPDVLRSGRFADSQPGIIYRWGTSILGRWDGWVKVEVDSLAVHPEESSEPSPRLVLSCGIDGLGIVIYGLERDFPFAAADASVEVSWTADQTTATETWNLWTSNRSSLGRAISPRNDSDFYAAIRGADRLTVSSASNPRITDSFDLAGLGVWELPVIDGLDGCADAPREH